MVCLDAPQFCKSLAQRPGQVGFCGPDLFRFQGDHLVPFNRRFAAHS